MAEVTDILQAEAAFGQFFSQMNGKADLPGNNIRKNALLQFNKYGIPTQKHEDWKYTYLGKIFKKGFSLLPSSTLPTSIAKEIISDKNDCNIVILNGIFSQELSNIKNIPGLQILSIKNAIEQQHPLIDTYFGKMANTEKNSLSALNIAFGTDGVLIFVDENVKVPENIVLYNIITDDEKVIRQPHHLIVAAKGAEVNILERFIVKGKEYVFQNSLTEIHVASEAHVQYFKLQNPGEEVYQVDSTYVHQESKSTFSSVVISLSGELLRNNLEITVKGENALTHMYGLYMLKGLQHTDNCTQITHTVPNCESHQLYKGILDDESTGIFSGKIIVAQDAQKTNAFQSNKNILLSDHAAAFFRPQLEIFADDVKCSHGATSSQIEDSELFFLRARGIGKDKAKALLMYAFAADILEQIPEGEIRNEIAQTIASRLQIDY
jgi:Fe-S cluster assembly protein SufD